MRAEEEHAAGPTTAHRPAKKGQGQGGNSRVVEQWRRHGTGSDKGARTGSSGCDSARKAAATNDRQRAQEAAAAAHDAASSCCNFFVSLSDL